MAATWIKYKNNENATMIFMLDHATHFRHVAAGDESFVEVYAEGTMHSILQLTDPQAYQTVINFIGITTGFTLSS